MNWQVTIGGKPKIINLPDRIPVGKPFVANVDGESFTAEWHPSRQVISLLQKGVYHNIPIRSLQVSRFPGDSHQSVKSACWQSQMVYADAQVEQWVPGSANRAKAKAAAGHVLRSQITGKVLKVMAAVGDEVDAGDTLLVIEAMKMENKIFAPAKGKVTKVSAVEGTNIAVGAELLRME